MQRSERYKLNSVDDSQMLEETKQSMDEMGIGAEEQVDRLIGQSQQYPFAGR